MRAYVLFNLLHELGKMIKCEACRAVYHLIATRLINSVIQEHKMLDSINDLPSDYLNRNEINKFNIEARMLDSIHHLPLK